MTLREEANQIIQKSIQAVLSDEAVQGLCGAEASDRERFCMVAAGKAVWQMGRAAVDILQDKLEAGAVVTKYDHVKGEIPKTRCFEAGRRCLRSM